MPIRKCKSNNRSNPDYGSDKAIENFWENEPMIEVGGEIIVPIEQEDQDMIRRIASARNQKKEAAYGKTTHAEFSPAEAHYLGLLGEYAVGRYLKVPINKEVYGMGVDDGTDLIYKDWKLQVKYTGRETGDLFFNDIGDFSAHFAILTTPHSGGIRISGFISQPKFLKNHEVKNYGYGDRVCVPQTLLTPMWQFHLALYYFKDNPFDVLILK